MLLEENREVGCKRAEVGLWSRKQRTHRCTVTGQLFELGRRFWSTAGSVPPMQTEPAGVRPGHRQTVFPIPSQRRALGEQRSCQDREMEQSEESPLLRR